MTSNVFSSHSLDANLGFNLDASSSGAVGGMRPKIHQLYNFLLVVIFLNCIPTSQCDWVLNTIEKLIFHSK